MRIMPEHGPLPIFAAILVISGGQLLALGLLAEMQVRHHYDRRGSSAPYEVARIIPSNNERVSE